MNTAQGAEGVLRQQALPMAIEHFQILEERLKELLILFHQILVDSAPDYLIYNPPEKSIRKSSLGEVIKNLRIFSDDDDYMKELNDLVPLRNTIAHVAYVKYSKIDPTLENFTELINSTGDAIERTKRIIGKTEDIYTKTQENWKNS